MRIVMVPFEDAASLRLASHPRHSDRSGGGAEESQARQGKKW